MKEDAIDDTSDTVVFGEKTDANGDFYMDLNEGSGGQRFRGHSQSKPPRIARRLRPQTARAPAAQTTPWRTAARGSSNFRNR